MTMTSDEIKRRALALSEKTNSDTITPTEVGGIMYDTVGYMEDVERNGASLGIRKTYATVSAMEADLNPVGDDGSPLKKGMLVNIYDQDTPDSPDNGKVFSFQAPGWAFRTKIDAGYATKEELSELEDNQNIELFVDSYEDIESPQECDVVYNEKLLLKNGELQSISNYDTYVVKNNIKANKFLYVKADFASADLIQEQYLNAALYDNNDKFLFGCVASGVKIFSIPYNYTLKISISRTVKIIPVFGGTLIDIFSDIKSKIEAESQKSIILSKRNRFPVYSVYDVSGGTQLEEEPEGKSGVYRWGTSLDSTPYIGGNYKSYKISFEGDMDTDAVYDVCFRPITGNKDYRTFAIFDNETGNILLEQSFKSSNQWILVRCTYGQTLLVTAISAPLLNPSYRYGQEKFEDISKSVNDLSTELGRVKDSLLDKIVSRPSFLSVTANLYLAKSDDSYNDVLFTNDEKIVNVSWNAKENNSGYCYIAMKRLIKYHRNSQYCIRIKNTGTSILKFGVALSPKVDWSEGFLLSDTFEVSPNQTIEKLFSPLDWEDEPLLEDSEYIYIIIPLYGQLNINLFKDSGSFELQEFYGNILTDANRAFVSKESEHSKKSDYSSLSELSVQSDNSYKSLVANNAGWSVGGIAKDAVFRDSYPKGGSAGAMTLTIVDFRTIKLTTNFTEDEIGSKFRGVYWKISYDRLEDLKGKWLFTCGQAYMNTYINKAVTDWGSGIDIIKISSPKGNGLTTEYDLYSLIMEYKNAHQDDGKWTGLLEEQGFLYFQAVQYSTDGRYKSFEDTLTLDFIPEVAKVIATELSKDLEDNINSKIEDAISSQTIQVTNWGDSLTAGAGSTNHNNQATVLESIKQKGYPDLDLTESSNITYSIMMQKLLGDTYKVTNCGVGGENINTIASRLGANIAYATEDFVLPQDETPVQIGTYSSKLNSAWGVQVSPLLQGAGNSVNPCYVQGIECTLKWTGSGGSDEEGVYTLQRVIAGDRSVNLSSKTPIIMSGSKLYRNTKLSVIWCWQNGGYSSTDELIEKLDKIISHVGTSNYLLVGLHSGTAESRAEQEETLTKKYGDKFFNWREYASTNALYDFGLNPTEEDLTEMSKGSMPKTLLIDSVHLCAAGYAILGFKIIERFKNLGYVE